MSTSTPNEAAEPDWRAALRANIADLPVQRSTPRPEAIAIGADFLPGVYGAIVKAANARRLSPTSYVRRAALALAAHDLNIPLTDLLERDPRMSRQSGFGVDDPEGTKFGPWVIDGLSGGAR